MTSIEQGRLASLIRRNLLAAHMLGAVLGIVLGGMLAILVRTIAGLITVTWWTSHHHARHLTPRWNAGHRPHKQPLDCEPIERETRHKPDGAAIWWMRANDESAIGGKVSFTRL